MRCEVLRSVILLATLPLILLSSCGKDSRFEPGFSEADSMSRSLSGRTSSVGDRKVMIMVSAGFNNLSEYLREDLSDLESGYIPQGTYFSSDVLLVLSRITAAYGNYESRPAVLYRLYRDHADVLHRDTLYTWPATTALSRASTLHDALTLVKNKFPSAHYGMVFSSHASGWLPELYYNDPGAYERKYGYPSMNPGALKAFPSGEIVFPPIDPYPAVKTIGSDTVSGGSSVEIELKDFAEAIPMHLEYLLVDACLSGCVEVAYAFKDKADLVGFSPAEILADGFNYRNLAQHLLVENDPQAVCEEYFDFYNSRTRDRCATITLVDTRELDELAGVCRELFGKYRTVLSTMDGDPVQGFFRFDRHFFYDLKDILVKAGITADESARLDAALARCIPYKAATPTFLGIQIKTYCGLSMYLPSMGTSFLNGFYKENMAWNDATELVQ
ncbi:MAG: hypothetical protein IJR34_07335 [Bacteroidales bacterium]|nr:hypothetical protein [Bacteroidales bacterium]